MHINENISAPTGENRRRHLDGQRAVLLLALLVGLLLGMQWRSPGAQADSSVGTAVTFSCTDSEAVVADKGGPRVTNGDSTIYIGYRQLGNNKDPVAARFTESVQDWCHDDYETTGDDNTGYGLFWDGSAGGLYGVFSATGTQGDPSQDFRRFATAGWLKSYSDASSGGGGPKVAILARMDPATGAVLAASFVTARKPSDGKVNSLVVKDLELANGQLVVRADSWYSPRNPDRSVIDCDGDSPFDYTIRFTTDLSTVNYAAAPGCVGNVQDAPAEVTVRPTRGFVGTNAFVATAGPTSTQLPLTYTWHINGTPVQTTTAAYRLDDTLTFVWPEAAAGTQQTLQVWAENARTQEQEVPAAASPLYTFTVTVGHRVYMPLVSGL